MNNNTDINSPYQSSPFANSPLDRTETGLRLWKFSPLVSGQMHLSLANFDLARAPKYVALSYLWGSQNEDNFVCVSVNNDQLRITKNLAAFLAVLSKSKSYVPPGQLFWADQISINQEDLTERNHQVRLMSQIYKSADTVFAWLGNMPHAPAFDPDVFAPWKSFQPAMTGTLVCIVLDAYWTRLWIVQELRLARHLILWCRTHVMDARTFQQRLEAGSPLTALWDSFDVAGSELEDSLARASSKGKQFWIQLRTLLAASSREMSLFEVLSMYSGNDCSDPRDRVFGLQALVHASQRVDVDYNLSMDTVILYTMRTLLEGMVIPDNFGEQKLLEKLQPVRALVRSLGCVDEANQKLCDAMQWALVIPKIPWNPRLRTADVTGWAPSRGVFTRLMTTDKQKALSKDLVDTIERIKHAPIVSKRERRLLLLKLFEEDVARHGFKMFGMFLAHPDEWVFSDCHGLEYHEWYQQEKSKAETNSRSATTDSQGGTKMRDEIPPMPAGFPDWYQ